MLVQRAIPDVGVAGPILVLTSSLLTDRMVRYSTFLGALKRHVDVVVWSTAARPEGVARMANGDAATEFLAFPAEPEFPHGAELLRRLNDTIWMGRLNLPSRVDQISKASRARPPVAMRALASPVRAIHGESAFECFVGRRLVRSMSASVESRELSDLRPSAVLSMTPMWSLEAAWCAAALSQGIPTFAFMTSFDNLSTKRRVELPFDRWLLWSDEQRRQLTAYYPRFPIDRTTVVGAPQFDVFFDPIYHRTRADWCGQMGLDPGRPIVLHALGSPNFIREAPGAIELARRIGAGELGEAQLVIRPHPIHDDAALQASLSSSTQDVVVQQTSAPSAHTRQRFQDEAAIVDWVNTFRHADVVVNLSSSVTVDSCVAGRPVVSLDFDPHPDGSHDSLVKAINRTWPHFSPIANSGGVWMARNYEDLMVALRTYLKTPALHADERAWVAEFVCGKLDGRSGARLAASVMEGISGTPWQGHRCEA